jgi:hypothetical protein
MLFINKTHKCTLTETNFFSYLLIFVFLFRILLAVNGKFDMSFELTDDDGKFLVKLVRDTVETFLKTGRMLKVSKDVPQKFYRKCGVFVTINMFDKGEKVLRGCIGYPYPTSSLVEAVVDLSINAATEDSTFSIYDF